MSKKHTFWFVTCLLIFQITALAEDTSAPINARQVMLKFVESQKKLKSYIIKSKSKSTYVYTGIPPYNGRGTRYCDSVVRFDGNRVKESVTSWGDTGQIKNLPKENAFYQSILWDVERGYELSLVEKNRRKTAKYPGSVQIHVKGGTYTDYIKEKYKRTMISSAQGYVFGNDQDIGTMFLRDDANVKLLDKRSNVNGVDCYVIEAAVPERGTYRAWIDPVHGFNLARLRSRRKTGDFVNRQFLGKDVLINHFYEVLEFQEVGGVWLPKTFIQKDSGHDGGYDYDSRGVTQTELYEVNLDLDHDKEGSFLTDDIPNGTQVRLEGVPLDVIMTWQDGKVVDKRGNVIMTCYVPNAGPDANDAAWARPAVLAREKLPTAAELLDKYAETQGKLQSFRLKSKDIINAGSSFRGVRNRPEYKETDFRFDGERSSCRMYTWGDIGEKSLTRNQAMYYSTLWNEKSFIRHSRGADPSDLGLAMIHNDKNRSKRLGREMVSRSYQGHSLMGYFFGDDERVDSILRQATSISVRRETENVNGIDCFVIDAITSERGRYALWIDPEHGYNIAKAELRRDGEHGHKFYDHSMSEDEKILSSLENVRFKKIDNVWVPMEADYSMNRTWSQKQDFVRDKVHHKRYKFVLNPDHGTLKSFVPDDIPNGASANIVSFPSSLAFIWQDGKVVDKRGKVIKTCYEGEAGPDPNDAAWARPTAAEVSVAVRYPLPRYAANSLSKHSITW